VGRTTIARDLIAMIKCGKAQKEEVLRHLEAASEGAERLRKGMPAITVKFEQLDLPKDREPLLARGTEHYVIDEPRYELVLEAPMYALSDDNRVDVLRFGRHPDQDVQLLDIRVSREHGLIIYSDKLPLFCDYGTMIDGARAGSLNGTYLDGVSRVRDTMIQWLPIHGLHLGTQFSDTRGNALHGIRVSYVMHAVPPPDDEFGN
jgi:hypothetical protein